MVKKYFPETNLKHSDICQVDHCFSRGYKEIFIDVANGTVICSNCNCAKGPYRNKVVDLLVNEIVIKREGQDTFNRLKEIATRKCGFPYWNKRWWIEEQISILEEKIEELKCQEG